VLSWVDQSPAAWTKKFYEVPAGTADGQVHAETCFQKFVSNNLQSPRGLPEADLIKKFTELKLNLSQGIVCTALGDLLKKVLTFTEAKTCKVDIATQAKRQKLLVQTEQPRAIECAA